MKQSTASLFSLAGLAAAALLVAATAHGEGADTLIERLKKLRPNIPINDVHPTPAAGIYALELEGGTILYGTEDGRFLFAGDMYELTDASLVNLAETRRSGMRRDLMNSVSRDEMLVFAPEGATKASITVFTDVDCGYCRKLHQEVPALNSSGVEVRYVAYPRAGVGSESYNKIVSAWCAKNPQQALTDVKAGKTIPQSTCDNPVAGQYDLGQRVGVTGTPAIVLEDGRLLPGYMPAADLVAALGL